MLPRKANSLGMFATGRETTACALPPWLRLEQFANELERGEQQGEAMRQLLDTLRALTPAEVVFIYAESPGEEVTVVGESHIPAEACRSLAAALLAGHPAVSDRLLCAEIPAAAWTVARQPPPRQVGLVRFSQSRNLWVGGLVFQPGRVLQLDHLACFRIAARMLLQSGRHTRLTLELKDTLFGTIQSFTAALDAKDPYTCGHSERVGRMAVRLGEALGLADGVTADLYLAGLLHDIGKIGVPDAVLRKPGRLSDEEFKLIQSHTVIGDQIVSTVRHFARLRPGVRHHHERYDGTGYPDRLGGEDIPLLGRILAVADACDAMLSTRTYRQSRSCAELETILQAGSGTQWDPRVIEAFMAARSTLYPICQKGLGHSLEVVVNDMLDRAAEQSRSPANVPARAEQ